MKADLYQALLEGGTVLTANIRLTRHLRKAFDSIQIEKGLLVWQTPDIIPWPAWLERCWEDALDAQTDNAGQRLLLLNPLQEQVLWERVIRDSPRASALLQIQATAQAAADAWSLMHAWQMGAALRQATANDDLDAYLEWSAAFQKACTRYRYLDSGRLPEMICEYLKTQVLTAPTCVIFYGFTKLTPQQQTFFEVLNSAGCHTGIAEPERDYGHAECRAYTDTAAEIRASAQWARRLIEQHPDVSIGIIVPDLGAVQSMVRQIMDNALRPDLLLPGATDMRRPYNVSLGQSLSSYPLIHSALLILELAQGELPLGKTGSLLRSPFLAGAEQEMAQRALLDARLRQLRDVTVSLPTLHKYASEPGEEGGARPYSCPLLAARLTGPLVETSRIINKQQSPSAWWATFMKTLDTLGWPGERPLNSKEHQTLMAWQNLDAHLSSLDMLAPRISCRNALGLLRQLAANTLFQPESADVPVQILGILEGAGLDFDYLWVMGLHDEMWPAHARPNPFLPVYLQHRLGLPHGSAEQELEFARSITDGWLSAAPEIILSHPRMEGDRTLRPSPLISAIPASDTADDVAAYSSYVNIIYATRALETVADCRAPALPAGARVVGGVALFKNQAMCPFCAFAEHRLGGRALQSAASGFDSSERGTLLHDVLARVWSALKSHQQLCALTDDDLRQLIDVSVRATVERLVRRGRLGLAEVFVALEQARLARFAWNWLQLEKQRKPFQVLACEEKRSVTFGGVEVNLRLDRIDRLENGQEIIIDYKSTAPSPAHKGWLGERLDEPQLPLYCVTADTEVVAIAFAQIKLGNLEFTGISRDADLVPGLHSFAEVKELEVYGSWDSLLKSFKKTLTALGEQYLSGIADVNPKNHKTCTYCDQSPLCRVGDSPIAQPDEDREQADD